MKDICKNLSFNNLWRVHRKKCEQMKWMLDASVEQISFLFL